MTYILRKLKAGETGSYFVGTLGIKINFTAPTAMEGTYLGLKFVEKKP